MEVMVRSYMTYKAPVISPPPTKATSSFLQTDALPVAQQTVSEYWGEGITFHGPAHRKFTWGSSTLVVTTKGCCLPWQRVAKPLTGLWCQFLIQTTDCRVYIIRNNRHTSTWLVTVWTLSYVTTISFGLFLQWTYTYVHTTDNQVCCTIAHRKLS